MSDSKIKILVLMADPKSLDHLQLEKEVRDFLSPLLNRLHEDGLL